MIAPTRTLTLTTGGQAQFRYPYDPALNELLRAAIPGVRFAGRGAWTVRAIPANIRAIRAFALEHGFAGVEAAAVEQDRLFEDVRRGMKDSRAGAADFPAPSTLGGTLRPFQLAGLRYIVSKEGRCLVADEMGLGKTVETLAALEALNALPAVIVCPASLLYNWQAEAQKWLPHRSVFVFSSSKEAAKINLPRVTIINYDILAKHVETLRALKPEAVVFDEGHLLKTAKSQRSTAAKKLRKGVRVRLLLTGTPVLNTPSELLNPLSIIGRLEDVGGFWHFGKHYCGGKQTHVRRSRKIVARMQRTPDGRGWDVVTEKSTERFTDFEKAEEFTNKLNGMIWDLTGSSNLPELAARLRATCMLRRRKADVLPELPARQVTRLPVDITTRAEYDEAQADVLRWVARRAGRDPEFRAAIAHLDPDRQMAAIIGRAQRAADRAAQAEELVKIEALKQISARGKIAAATEFSQSFIETRQKLIVFAWHQETLAALAKALDAPVIDGDTPARDREALVRAYQSTRSTMPILLLNLQAGGVGLTLTAASNVLVVEFPWTPALLDQAIDRCHRIGQTRSVNAWLMFGRRTIDYPIWKMIERKREIMEGVTR